MVDYVVILPLRRTAMPTASARSRGQPIQSLVGLGEKLYPLA